MTRRAYDRLRHPRSPWQSWEGRGPRPVGACTRVSVLFRDGSTARGLAGEWQWIHDGGPDGQMEPDEIVGFRVRTAVEDCGRRAAA